MIHPILTQQIALITIIFGAYTIRGIAGYGSGLIAVPLLAFFHSLQFAVPLVLMLDFIASFILTRTSARNADWSEIKLLLPFGLAGAAFGTFVLIRFSATPIVIGLAVSSIVFGLRDIFGIEFKASIARGWAAPAGLIGSCTGALFGTSAPAYIIYLSGRLKDPATIRATFSWLFLIDGCFRLCLFVATGLLFMPDTRQAIASAILPMLAGLYLGHHINLAISNRTMRRLIGILLFCSGISLMTKVFL